MMERLLLDRGGRVHCTDTVTSVSTEGGRVAVQVSIREVPSYSGPLEYSNLLMAVVLAINVKFKYTNIIAPQYYLQRTLIRAGESTVFFIDITNIPTWQV